VQAIEPAAQQLAPLVPTVDPVAPVEAPPPSGNDIVVTDDKDEATPMPFPTPAVIEIAGNALADASAPTAVSAFTLGCGAFKRRGGRLSRAPRLSSPTPAVEPRADLQRLWFTRARTACPRRLRLRRVPPLFAASSPSGCHFPIPPTGGRESRAGSWSPAALGLAGGGTSGTRPPIHYSDEVA
jgi:hypothetical protein